MAVRYHISPNTGRPNICRAEKQECPVGGAHFDSKEDARAGYESEMSNQTITTVSKKAKPSEDEAGTDAESYYEGDYEYDPASDPFYGEPDGEDVVLDESDNWIEETLKEVNGSSNEDTWADDDPWADDEEESQKPKAYSWD